MSTRYASRMKGEGSSATRSWSARMWRMARRRTWWGLRVCAVRGGGAGAGCGCLCAVAIVARALDRRVLGEGASATPRGDHIRGNFDPLEFWALGGAGAHCSPTHSLDRRHGSQGRQKAGCSASGSKYKRIIALSYSNVANRGRRKSARSRPPSPLRVPRKPKRKAKTRPQTEGSFPFQYAEMETMSSFPTTTWTC